MSTQLSTDAKAVVRALEGVTKQLTRIADLMGSMTEAFQRFAELHELQAVPGIEVAGAEGAEARIDIFKTSSLPPLLWIGPDGDRDRRCEDVFQTEDDGPARCHRGLEHYGHHRGISEAGREYTWPNAAQLAAT